MTTSFSPDPQGTLLPDGTRWGAFDPEKVSFEGDVDHFFVEPRVELVASGFRWTEGPTWLPDRSTLIFSDTIDARVYQLSPDNGASVWLEASGGYDGSNVENFNMLFEPGSNGMALSGDDLYVCQHPTHRVVRVRIPAMVAGARFCENEFEVLADSFNGRPLNSPNDVVLGPDGSSVWFTDPPYGHLQKQSETSFFPVLPEETADAACHNPCDLRYLDERVQELGAGQTGVYRLRDGKLELVTGLHNRPNGLAFDDQGRLWVANSDRDAPSFTAYRVREELPLEPIVSFGEKELGQLPGGGLFDGFKIDEHGFIWTSMPAGICIIDPNPECPRVVAKVLLNTNTSNIVFGHGGDVWVTGLGHIWRLQRKIY